MRSYRKDQDGDRQTLSPPSNRIRRWKVLLLSFLLCGPTQVQMSSGSLVHLSPGPLTGIVAQEIPNLLLTEHRSISQLVYVDLDIAKELEKLVSLKNVHDVAALSWYAAHVERSRDAVRDILRQAEKCLVVQQPPAARPKRALGGVVMGVMALLTVVGVVVGTTMNAVNTVSIKELREKNEILQDAIDDIRESLTIQHKMNEELVRVVQDTIVVASLQTDRLDHTMKMQENFLHRHNLYFTLFDPVTFFTMNYLRQVEQDVNNLLRAYIPLHFVDVRLVRQALSSIHGPDLDPAQIRIAFEAGTAVPMFFDLDRLHISFLLTIPLVKRDKIYQLKKISNVGTWEGDTKTKINTPSFIAYQNTSDLVLVPNLQHCQIFKDTNYLCPGNPFLPTKEGFLCGLEKSTTDSTLCDVTVSRSTAIVTEVMLIKNVWLVSTNALNMTVTYTKHGTFSIKPILHSTFTTVVPKDVIVSIGTETLFYVSVDNLEGGMELMNTLKTVSIPHDTDLDFLLDKKQSHSLQLLLKQDNISISDLKFSAADSLHFNSGNVFTEFIQIMWSGSTTIWMACLTIMAIYHHKYIKQNTRRNCWKQRDTEIPLAVV